jgi:hypothetical protein
MGFKMNKSGYFHKGQVSDAASEEKQDNISQGKGPRVLKHALHAKPSNKPSEDKVNIDPGYEDPIKIQKVQREGITPDSQNFMKR